MRRGGALTRRARASWKESRNSLAHEVIAEEAASTAGSSSSSAGGAAGVLAEGAVPVAISASTGNGESPSGQDTPPSSGLLADSDAGECYR